MEPIKMQVKTAGYKVENPPKTTQEAKDKK